MPVRFLHKRRSKITICDTPLFLDIETSHNHDPDNPICWIVSIQIYFDDHYHLFRTPEELMEYFLLLYDRMKLSPERRLFIYIHNASYDLSYLLPYIQRYLPFKEERKGILHGEHKIISYQQGGLEFRCSYLLSGVSLERWSNEMDIEHKKQVGIYDYDEILYQDSDLDQEALTYDEYDVLAMKECFQKQLEAHGDDITTIPLTSTGYSRRLLRSECTLDPYYRTEYFLSNQLNLDMLLMCVNGYAGGYTHNNRYKKSQVIIDFVMKSKKLIGKIKHKDFRSHYPSQIRTYPLPWGKGELYYDIREHDSYKSIYGHNINMNDICNMWPAYFSMVSVEVYDMQLRDPKCSMPFMQISKIFKRSEGCRIMADNGRLIAMSGGHFTTYVDNLTLQILQEQYNIKYKILQVYRWNTMTCPEPIAKVVDELFKAKSDYKILHQKYQKLYGEFDERTIEAAFKLMQAKKLLNAIYGCFATSPLRKEFDLDFENFNEDTGEFEPLSILKDIKTPAEMQIALNDYYKSRSNFLHYPVGMAITALARYELYEYIKCIGYDHVLYCDTDSIFYTSNKEIEARIDALNVKKRATAPYITNINGENVYYDVFESEPDIIAFKGLHSKCYGYITEYNELKLVVAGVPERTLIGLDENKKPIYLTREEELKGVSKDIRLKSGRVNCKNPLSKKAIRRNIDHLQKLYDRKEFIVNTGVTAKYIVSEPHIECVNGHYVSTAGGCIISKLKSKQVIDLEFTDDLNVEYYEFYNEAL